MTLTSSTTRIRVFFFNHPPTTEIYTLSLHDALPICTDVIQILLNLTVNAFQCSPKPHRVLIYGEVLEQPIDHFAINERSEEHTSELQSRFDLVCRLLLEKKKKRKTVAEPHSSGSTRN